MTRRFFTVYGQPRDPRYCERHEWIEQGWWGPCDICQMEELEDFWASLKHDDEVGEEP